jgi:hypothetical protein
VSLLTVGSFHHGEVPDNAQGRWSALICDDSLNCTTRSVLVTTRKVHDEMVDEDENAKTGTEVAVVKDDGIVALVRGVNVQEGSIKTYFHGVSNLESGSSLKVSARGIDYQLKVDGPRSSSDEPLPKGSKLNLSSGSSTQELFGLPEGGNDPYISVLWIGDLDGDGIPDYLINASDHYNVSNIVLYLSTRAKIGQIVGHAAHFVSVGC